MKRFSFIAALLLCFVTAASAAIRPAQPGIGGGGGTVSGSITGAYSFSSGFTTVNATNVSMLPAISNLAINVAYTNAAMIFSNVLTLNPTSTTPRLNGMHLTNQAALARVGDTIRVSPGTYWSPTNVFSVLRNGVNWDVAEGATLIFGTTGDESDYNIPFNDWSGAVTSYISGAGTFIVSNNLANLLNLTNSASRVIWFGKEIRAANDQAAVMQGHPNDTVGGGSKLWLYLSDGLYSDGYDAYINQHNPNSAQTFIYASRLYGDNDDSGDSAFETTVGYANPGDCVVRVGAARGSVTLAQNMDLELGVLDLGAFNMVYSPTNDSGNGVLRNTYIYGTSNRTTSLIYSTDGRFGTAGTYVQCTLVGSTNRPIALITNDAVGKITFISSRFLDGFGATNSIRSVNAQRVTLVATDTPLGLHANVTAAVATNQAEARFRQLATFETGIDVSSDLNANGQLNAGDFTTTGTTIIGGPLEIPTGASSGYVLTSDGSGVATWAAPTGGSGGGGTNFPNVNLLLGGTNLTLSAGVRKAYHNQTNGSHGINLNLAVPESGYEVVYSLSNSGSSDITVTFYTNSVAANPYDIASKTNVNTFTAAASAITKVKLTYTANGLWLLDRVDGPASILKFGSGITAVTNGVNNLDVTISASGGTTAGPDGSQLISMDGETQWINGEDFFVQESFYSGQSNPWGTTRTTSGGSAIFTGNPGYVRLSSYPTNTANYAAFHYGAGATATVPWQSNLFIEAKLQILNSGDITNSEFSVGFYNAMQTLPTTATVRWIGRGDWNPNWIAAVGVGSTYSYATTGLAIAHSTPYTLKIKGTTNSLAFYTNGVLFTTLTSNLPGGVAIQPGARSMATVNTGTVDDNSLDVDWLNIKAR